MPKNGRSTLGSTKRACQGRAEQEDGVFASCLKMVGHRDEHMSLYQGTVTRWPNATGRDVVTYQAQA